MYFVTFRLMNGALSAPERRLVLDHVRFGDGRFYDLFAAVVLPDHVHLPLQPHSGVAAQRILGRYQRSVSALSPLPVARRGPLWQDEWCDRIVRDADELDEKLHYMLNNPLKLGLVDDPWAVRWLVRAG